MHQLTIIVSNIPISLRSIILKNKINANEVDSSSYSKENVTISKNVYIHTYI